MIRTVEGARTAAVRARRRIVRALLTASIMSRGPDMTTADNLCVAASEQLDAMLVEFLHATFAVWLRDSGERVTDADEIARALTRAAATLDAILFADLEPRVSRPDRRG